MLLKFFKMKTGSDKEPGSIRYCLNNPTAKVVKGDPDFTQWVIDHSPAGMRQRFASGVINNLTKLDPFVKSSMLDGFEQLMLGGRHESSMALCMIDHVDKGKHETHFIAPLFDLMFGKLIHPYIDRIDRHRFAAWCERFALIHDLEHANENLRITPKYDHLRLQEVDKKFLDDIWQMVHAWVVNGEVTCRQDLQRKFSETSYEVKFFSKHDKPLQQPVILGPDGNALRLTHSIYYVPHYRPDMPGPLNRTDKKAVKKRLDELEKILRDAMQFRAHHLIGRLFGKMEQGRVIPGKARSHLARLIAEKHERDLALDAATRMISVNDFLLKHGWRDCGALVQSKPKPDPKPALPLSDVPTLAERTASPDTKSVLPHNKDTPRAAHAPSSGNAKKKPLVRKQFDMDHPPLN